MIHDPIPRTLVETLRCYGYHGFGSGFEMASNPPEPKVDRPAPLYCSRACQVSNDCWKVHRRRVASMVPDLAAAFEEMAKTYQGQELVTAWWEKYKAAPPELMVMTGNVEDGACVASGRSPKDRKGSKWTLTWPLTPLPISITTLES